MDGQISYADDYDDDLLSGKMFLVIGLLVAYACFQYQTGSVDARTVACLKNGDTTCFGHAVS